MKSSINEKIEQRVLTAPPSKSVISGSTPVISFGDFTSAKVATLGINPSCKEFLSGKTFLKTGKKRLVDYDSLGLKRNEKVKPEHVDAIWLGCKNYFSASANPYMVWFGQLDQIIRQAGFSYLDGSACHLDLVQWATNPVWGNLSKREQSGLLAADLDFFLWQSEMPNIQLRLLNGRTAINSFMEFTEFKLQKVDQIKFKNGERIQPIDLFKGQGRHGEPVLGWSINIQSARLKQGVKPKVINLLGQWVASQSK